MTDSLQGYSSGFPGGNTQFAPQGFFGGLLGAPLGGAAGRAIGGLFGNPNLGSQIGQIAGGIGGSLLPFGADPVTAAYAQQQALQAAQQQALQSQLAPQGWIGNLIGQVGQPLGSAIGGMFGNPRLGGQIGGIAGQVGRLLPFEVDPVTAAYAQQAQQAQFAPQGFFGNLLGQVGQPLGGAIGGMFGNARLGSQIGGIAGQVGRLLPFEVDPITAAYAQQAQQAQLAPQGWIGNLIGQVGQPLGSAIGGMFGNARLGGQIGGIAGQVGRLLPFEADPVAAAYAQQQALQAQQAQFAPQGFFGNLLGQVGQPLGGAIGSMFGNARLGSQIGGIAGQVGRLLPFEVDPVTAAYAQQQAIQQAQQAQQFAPQGFFGNLLGQVGQPLGSAIGGMFGNPRLGGQIGGIAGQVGRLLPFDVDPVTAAYAQQQAMQQAMQQAQQAQQGATYPGYQVGQPGAGGYTGQPTLH